MKRVGEENLPHGTQEPGGVMIQRNPGVTLVWQTLRPYAVGDGRGGVLFDIGEPHAVEWYAYGRQATRAEVMESITTGLPLLEEQCQLADSPDAAFAELQKMAAAALDLVPA
jgi:hypothetical protein